MALEMKYFVLKPRGTDKFAEASRAAMLRYAAIIAETDPGMAEQLADWVHEEADKAADVRRGKHRGS